MVSVEAGAVRARVGAGDGAAGVLHLPGGLGVAVGCSQVAREAATLDAAARAGVECHDVGGLRVDAFHYVDFASLRPVWSDEPERWPHSADAAGHVVDVGDEESMVEGLFGRESNARTSSVYFVDGVHPDEG